MHLTCFALVGQRVSAFGAHRIFSFCVGVSVLCMIFEDARIASIFCLLVLCRGNEDADEDAVLALKNGISRSNVGEGSCL